MTSPDDAYAQSDMREAVQYRILVASVLYLYATRAAHIAVCLCAKFGKFHQKCGDGAASAGLQGLCRCAVSALLR